MLRFIIKTLLLCFLLLFLPSCSNRHLSLMMDREITNLAWSPDGQFLAIVPADSTIHLWNSSNNTFAQTISAQPIMTSVSWSPDGSRIASASGFEADGLVDLWDIPSGDLAQSRPISISKNRIVAWSPQGSTISLGVMGGGILLWDLDEDQDRTLEGASEDILNIAWSPDGRFLAAGLQDGSIYIWDTEQNELLYKLSYSPEDYIADLSWSPDGNTLAAASCFGEPAADDSCRLVLWNPSNNEYLWVMQGGVYEITAVAWSPNGRWIASALTSGDIVLLKPSTGQRVRTLRTPAGLTVIAWSPDGKRLAAGSEDGSVLVWDVH